MADRIITLKLHVKSTRPALWSNVRLANPFDPIVKEIKAITDKKDKSEESMIAKARLEWRGGWYWSEGDDSMPQGPVLPMANLLRSFIGAARQTRSGKLVERGVNAMAFDVPLEYDGPRDLTGLWGRGLEGSPYVDFRPVAVNGGKKIQRCRPRLPEWEATTLWTLDTEILGLDKFLDIATLAGTAEGVGDYRLLFGRFEVSVL